MSNGSQELSPLPADLQIDQFLTRVWEHRLVTGKVAEFRNAARQNLLKFFEDHGVDQSTYIAIPTGSFLWIPDEGSDADFIVIALNEATHEKVREFFPGYRGSEEIKKSKLDVIRLCNQGDVAEDISGASDQEISALFLTPDKYLVGNVTAARKLRLDAINAFKENRPISGWETMMDENFSLYYRDWEKDPANASIRKGKKTNHSREDRLHEGLRQLAINSKNPAAIQEAFLSARDKMSVPNFDTYLEAVTAKNGALGSNKNP